MELISSELAQLVLFIRGRRVMIDRDLAQLYQVTTRRLNEQVKRNRTRFPEDFMFQLNATEKAEVVAKCDHLRNLKYSNKLPYAFTEHGTLMLANVLKSEIAVHASIQVVRTFIRLRQNIAASQELKQKIDQMEKTYNSKFKVIFDAIRQLMTPPQKQRKHIGFKPLP